MDHSFLQKLYLAHQGCHQCPRSEEIARFFNSLLGLMFPNFASKSIPTIDKLRSGFEHLRLELADLLMASEETSNTVALFFDRLPAIYEQLLKDVEAIYEGDPAATSKEEVIRSYPGFYAIAAYRIAHQLMQQQIAVLPRSITEYAHNITGIDIHPSAQIGSYFFIDHGTGIVIGATCDIGDHVKIYQGVTLGAMSVDKHLANTKRHPTIEDHVVIYSGATILGGDTVIGHHATIGGNAWLTKSVPPYSRVLYQPQITFKNMDSDQITQLSAEK